MLLQLSNVSHEYTYGFLGRKKKQILNNISFAMQENECLALVGPSGCGKSTLARIIANLQKPTHGKILFNEKKILFNTLQQRRDFYKQVQILFQDLCGSLNPRYSIFENLQEPLLYLFNIKNKESQLQKIKPILDSLQLSENILSYYPDMISGGQAQRVCIARMLLIQPKLILLDESTSGLDFTLQEEVWKLFLSLQQKTSCSFLFITHDILLAKRFCQKLMLMQNGEIIECILTNENFQSKLGQDLIQCSNTLFL